MFYSWKHSSVGSHLEDFGNVICSLIHATRSLITIQRKLVYVLQHADQAEFAPWCSVEKPYVEKFGQHYTLLSSGLSVLCNVEIYKTSGEIFSFCK